MNEVSEKNQSENESVDIYSHSKKPRSKKMLVLSICLSVFSVLLILTGSAALYANSLLSRYQYVEDEPDPDTTVSKKPIASVTDQKPEEGKAEKIDGLYHDDMVTNILLLGVDDYMPNDPGRSDSLLMVSLDRRHQKLKMTSFMRDTYVSIPGYNMYKLNTGYFLGGAPLQVKTIEKNFSVDIDRYIIIDFSAFPKIIDALGGITLELSADEAAIINKESGETGAVEGVNHLSGKQARYFSRIRDYKFTDKTTGEVFYNDYGRIRRQQYVMDTLVAEFKNVDAGKILTLANEIVPYLVSNISPDEMLTLAKDALTYMSYPIESAQVPHDELHYGETLHPAHIGAPYSVLIPDIEENTLYLNHFLYEDSFPELADYKLPSERGENQNEE